MNDMYIKGSDKVCGVIGNPIEHTLSPMIHNALADELGQRAIYVPFCVKKDNLKEAIIGAHALGIQGLNVTMPHKQEMFKYVKEVAPEAQKVGAINTLIYSEAGYIGDNTDAKGLAFSLKAHEVEWKDKKVAIIGSGGAAYAAYTAVAREADVIYLVNRTIQKAEGLKSHMKAHFDVPTFVYEDQAELELDVDLVIQTTGLGMGDLKGQMPKCSQSLLKHAKVAVDLIYEPWETLFLQTAKAHGCNCINGFEMLYYQAIIAFELMHHISCERETVLRVKSKMLNKVLSNC